MQHPIYRVRDFAIVGDFTLRVTFDDATEQVINFGPVLAGELFGPLRDLALFNQVGADFDPATLHDWPLHVPALAARARGWEPHRV